ncbi:hypothetical protein [Candidatus Bathycorpusculum sp.]|uniref:hypothetical protein n=1 Tax=Candidatus Bathycorpusculum sp. TaxID=2994959 RepID=UPI00282A804F|nr:hypothetical protein [Candidatus Termitimicrobium sp.]
MTFDICARVCSSKNSKKNLTNDRSPPTSSPSLGATIKNLNGLPKLCSASKTGAKLADSNLEVISGLTSTQQSLPPRPTAKSI